MWSAAWCATWEVRGVDKTTSWMDVDSMLDRAAVRLEWQRASEFESGDAMGDGECGVGHGGRWGEARRR